MGGRLKNDVLRLLLLVVDRFGIDKHAAGHTRPFTRVAGRRVDLEIHVHEVVGPLRRTRRGGEGQAERAVRAGGRAGVCVCREGGDLGAEYTW